MSLKVTKEFIVKNTTNEESGISAINSPQAKILGLEWGEIVSGWRNKVIGKVISNRSAELFILLNGVRGKQNQKTLINNFKNTNKLF